MTAPFSNVNVNLFEHCVDAEGSWLCSVSATLQRGRALRANFVIRQGWKISDVGVVAISEPSFSYKVSAKPL